MKRMRKEDFAQHLANKFICNARTNVQMFQFWWIFNVDFVQQLSLQLNVSYKENRNSKESKNDLPNNILNNFIQTPCRIQLELFKWKTTTNSMKIHFWINLLLHYFVFFPLLLFIQYCTPNKKKIQHMKVESGTHQLWVYLNMKKKWRLLILLKWAIIWVINSKNKF